MKIEFIASRLEDGTYVASAKLPEGYEQKELQAKAKNYFDLEIQCYKAVGDFFSDDRRLIKSISLTFKPNSIVSV